VKAGVGRAAASKMARRLREPRTASWEETGYRLSGGGKFLMQRVKDGVDFTTYLADVDDEFVPKLNHEHSAYGWFDPNEVLEEAATVMEP
jgi:hypothetical protein